MSSAPPAAYPTAAGWPAAALAYCSNVHPGETLDELLATLAGPVAAVRARRELPRMAGGLWIAADAAHALDGSAAARGRLATALDDAGIDLVTLNGFPYGGFHAASVKHAVYRPDWTEPQRLDYTLALARVLAALLPPWAEEGTISTLPLGQARGWGKARSDRSAAALCRLAGDLAEIEARSGRRVRVCLEPEPGCVLESAEQVARFFSVELPAAADYLGVPPALLERHLGVCFDVCHQAVMFEDVARSLALLLAAGITVGKIQLSSALEVPNPGNPETRAQLARYAEPRYLHQVRAPGTGGVLLGSDDLDPALADPLLVTSAPWRVHFHVPLQATRLAGERLATTRAALERTLAWLQITPHCRPHLEVETYTWEVLPASERPADAAALVDGIAGELAWVEQALHRRGLLVAP
ncbi:MAG TPA: metabolite traffic protein EboE [Gammaproteobacteria bacterium]